MAKALRTLVEHAQYLYCTHNPSAFPPEMRVQPGDWIVPWANNTFLCLDPVVFEATFEPAEQELGQ